MLIGAIANVENGRIVYTAPLEESHIYYGYKNDTVVAAVWFPVPLWQLDELHNMQGFVFCITEPPFKEGKGFLANIAVGRELELAYDRHSTYVINAVVYSLSTPRFISTNWKERLQLWAAYYRHTCFPCRPQLDEQYMPPLERVNEL